jgi:hypothetical protein
MAARGDGESSSNEQREKAVRAEAVESVAR